MKHDTARPLIEAQRVSRAVFRGLHDAAFATTHLGFVSTTEGQVDAERQVAVRFNVEAEKAGWDVRLEHLGPALPDAPYNWDAYRKKFAPALPGASHVAERWRSLGIKPFGFADIANQRADRASRGEENIKRGWGSDYVAAGYFKQAWLRATGLRWAIDYRRIGGFRFVVGDVSTIKLKRGTWLSDCFAFLWLQSESPEVNSRAFDREASGRWWDVLRKRVFWQRFDNEILLEANRAERAEIKSREYKQSATRRPYSRPSLPGFWNLRDYAEDCRLGFRQKAAGNVQHIPVTPALELLYSGRRERFDRQHLLIQIGRLYKEDCGLNFNHPYASGPFGDPGDGNEKFARSRAGTGSPIGLRKKSNDLRNWESWKEVKGTPCAGSWVIHPEGSAVRHARLKADMAAYNEGHPSYLNASNIGKTMRSRRSLNLPDIEATINRHRSSGLSDLVSVAEDARLSQTMDFMRTQNGSRNVARRNVSIALERAG